MLLNILQIIVSIILIALILIQERSSGFSGVFGLQGSAPYSTKRGLEKIIFYLTIFFAVLFAVLSILNII